MSVNLVCVDPKRINEVWPHARELIRSAIDYTGLNDFSDIETDILYGDQLLWLASENNSIEAAATTQIAKVNNQKICVLTACAGHHRERWLPLFEKIEQFAKNEGCVSMRIYGRKGWERVLNGYRVAHVILEKELG